MKIITTLILSLIILLLAACNNDTANKPATTTLPDTLAIADTTPVKEFGFLKKYTGTLGEEDIEMVLTNWNDGFLSGHYWFKKEEKPLELSGELLPDKSFKLIEMVNFKETGAFSANLVDPTHLTGTWTNAAMSKSLPFEVFELLPEEDAAGWAGVWHYNEIWDGGTLLIGNVSQDSFSFALTIFRGSHTGSVEGRAKITGNKALYKLADFEETPCILNFVHQGDRVSLSQKSTNFACGFGARANADGVYEKNYVEKKATLKFGPAEEAVFPTQALHDSFKALVGNSTYEIFAFNMQQMEKKPLKNSPKTMVTGSVAGLVGTHEAVIIYSTDGKIWAATLDFEATSNESFIRYFSNDGAFLNQMSPEIERWKKGFKNYRVAYESKNPAVQ